MSDSSPLDHDMKTSLDPMKTKALMARTTLFWGGLFALALAAGCNTAEGLGEDLEAAGETLKEKARDVND